MVIQAAWAKVTKAGAVTAVTSFHKSQPLLAITESAHPGSGAAEVPRTHGVLTSIARSIAGSGPSSSRGDPPGQPPV